MIFKPISDLVQLDQSKISDGMLLVRSGAENDAKDYKLTISNLLSQIDTSSSEEPFVIHDEYFSDGKQLSFSNVYCSGFYKETNSGGGQIDFGLPTPYVLKSDAMYGAYLYQLKVKVLTIAGASYIVKTEDGSSSFTSLNNEIILVDNYYKNSDIGINNVIISLAGKNQFDIRFYTPEKIRTNQSTPETYLTSNTPCTVICKLVLKKYIPQEQISQS